LAHGNKNKRAQTGLEIPLLPKGDNQTRIKKKAHKGKAGQSKSTDSQAKQTGKQQSEKDSREIRRN